ncbi:MAG: response regulator [Candidatus Dormibacter sp.]
MADEDARPVFGELLKQSQSALAGLQALEEQLSTRLADQHAQLQATRGELEESRHGMVSLQSTNDRLTAEHARSLDEAAHQRQARADLEATLGDVRRQLGKALHERDELAAAGDRDRRELEGRLAALEVSLAERVSRTAALEAQLDDLRAAQVGWQAEKDASSQAQEQLTSRISELEAGQGQAAEELARAIHNREQLRAVFEDLKRAHAELVQRSGASFKEMSRLQDEVRATATERDGLQADQLTWAADREALMKAARDQATRAVELAALAEKARTEAQAKYASLVERAQAAAEEWSTRRQALTDDTQRLAQELAEANRTSRAAEEAHRRLQAERHALEEAHRHEISTLEDTLRAARDATSRPLTPDQGHRINTRLNAIVGFASILLDSKANAIAAGEQADYLQLISSNSRGLAEELNLVSVAGAAEVDRTVAGGGLPVATLGGRVQPPTVLVADPDPAIRERLLSFLSRAGYEVVFVTTKEEAVKAAASQAPLLILIDGGLPPGGAGPLVAELKRDPRTAEIPLVVITGNLAERSGLDFGQVDVLSKPIDRHQLLQLMINYDLQADAKRRRKLPATVLLIDDDPLSLRLIKAVLTPLHIEVMTADGGKAGIELAWKGRPELIICDLLMPGVDGFEVIAALRAEEQTSKIPILVYTGKSITAEDQQRLHGLVPSIIRKGDFNQERFLEQLLKRGERRHPGATPPLAA